jgi:hypothetical protein
VRTKKGSRLHKKGSRLHVHRGNGIVAADVAAEISQALGRELAGRRAAAKALMRWTSASERTAKSWLLGQCLPGTIHLLSLMQQSDEVWGAVVKLVGRQAVSAAPLADVRHLLASALVALGGEQADVTSVTGRGRK